MTVLLTTPLLGLGLVLGFGWPQTAEFEGLSRLHPLTALSTLIATTAAWSATPGHGLLSGTGLTLGVTAGTRVAVLADAGPWFPVSTPALWAITPGTDPPAALALTFAIPTPSGALTLWSWSRLQLDR